MPRSKGPNKKRRSNWPRLRSKFYTHTGGRKGRTTRIASGTKKRKHGRR